jgi:hypothetical protein
VRHIPLFAPKDVDPKRFAPYLRQAVRETPERLSDLSASAKSSKKARKPAAQRPAARKVAWKPRAPASRARA